MLKLESYESLMLLHIRTDTKAYSGLNPNTYIGWSVVSVEEIKGAKKREHNLYLKCWYE